jgi:ribosome-binding protein aMBF1 (putative translation factor)
MHWSSRSVMDGETRSYPKPPHAASGEKRISHPGTQSDKIAAVMKSLADCLETAGMSVRQLVTTTGLDARLVKAIVSGNFTPSPAQRRSLADALGVSTEEIAWGHAVPVEHLRGNGPQCGRSS